VEGKASTSSPAAPCGRAREGPTRSWPGQDLTTMTRSHPAGRAQPLWTRDFVLATVVNALAMSIFYLLMTTMAVYAVRQFAASATGAGLASSMFIVGAVVTRLTGGIVDRAGPRRTLLAALAVFVVMSLAYLWVDSLPVL